MRLLLILLLALASANAGMWSVLTTADMQKVRPSAQYKLDTAGWAPRVYEFTTHSEPKMQCVIVFSSSSKGSSPTMHCIKK